ncbi:glycosyltransferase family 4 protein [Synechococcus sp. CS-205]|uniref:glycosyltransferase family 4 protein n=1 Tax=Synechococcus sp. CS-205 TaxID=2847984 RepID=UPI00223BD044|nr:glycosyltransferase family 4 protein [Synechococcus sp. CS-205]MCT0248067.1 glycosyltransferase family 4 protein [Synechococcus sp. CS-205]
MKVLILLDPEAVRWWSQEDRPVSHNCCVYCGSLKAWAELERRQLDAGVRWLGPSGAGPWGELQERLQAWNLALAKVGSPGPGSPAGSTIEELLCGDLAAPALLTLALLPSWIEQLAPAETVSIPVGRTFRPPRFGQLGDLPLLALAAGLEGRCSRLECLPVLDPIGSGGADHKPPGSSSWTGHLNSPRAWLAIGKLRHPELTLLALEAAGLSVRLFESERAAPLPALFAGTPAYRWNDDLDGPSDHQASPQSLRLPTSGAEAGPEAWLAALAAWQPLVQEARHLAERRLRLDRSLAEHWSQEPPQLILVPEENSRAVERLVALARQKAVPHAVLHHTAEVLPLHSPGRFQRHLRPGDTRLVPLRGQRLSSRDRSHSPAASVVMLDPVRAHLLDAVELEGSIPMEKDGAVGWLHYPLHQQSLVPFADPGAYWNAFDLLRSALAAHGIPLQLARKPPLEPGGSGDALAQGLQSRPEIRSLPALLANCRLVIAPGHFGTGHLEAMARGRPVVLVTPERMSRPSLLLEDESLPIPRLTVTDFTSWVMQQGPDALVQLASEQAEWLRQQLVSTQSLHGWLATTGVEIDTRPQSFLGSGLMAHRPLLDRVEAMDRLSGRLQALRRSLPGRLLGRLKRGWSR